MTTDIEYGIIYLFPFVYPLNNKTFCECGAAGAALCAVTSTFVGAAKGAVIGAVTGALTGAATGAVQGAVEGYKETGTLEGTLRGMGKGAAKGAVQGAQDGLLSGMVMGGISGAMNPSFCFVAGTSVLTTLGKKAIETVQVGDTIPCVDHITGEATEKKVISTTVNKVNRLIELDIDGEIIQCTETHPFQVKDKGWVDACDLNPGDVVYTKDWGTATVQSVNLLELDEPVEVFNFEVDDCRTYFVGEQCILVHNLCKQQLVAGNKKGWDARISVGSEPNHATPHAHIFFKNPKLASVSESGEMLVGNFGKLKGGTKFIADNLDEIAKGIQKWWFYAG